jgi:hypothetical protein
VGESTAAVSGVADPSLLPLATGQWWEDYTAAYIALDVENMVHGDLFNDPCTNAVTVKLTDPNFPYASNANCFAPQAGGGGPYISMPWISGGNVYYTICITSANQSYLIDYNYTLKTPGNGRMGPTSVKNTQLLFSYNPLTPRILFYVNNGGTLHRYDTDAMADDDTGYFPKSGLGSAWLTGDVNDRWFTAYSGGSTDTKSWDAENGGDPINWGDEADDEPHMTRDGGYVHLVASSGGVYDVGEGKISTEVYRQLVPEVIGAKGWGHPDGGPQGYMIVNDNAYPGRIAYYNPATEVYTHVNEPNNGAGHNCGTYQIDNESGTDAWVLASHYEGSQHVDAKLRHGGAFYRLSGECRLIALNFTATYRTGEAEPHHTASPDGKLVMFNGDMMNQGGTRDDVFLVHIPTS